MFHRVPSRRATIRASALCAVSLFMLATAGAHRTVASPPSAASRSVGDSAATDARRVAPGEVDSLIRRLGDADFARREAASKQLAELGEAALDGLLAHLEDPDPEIARRVEQLLTAPRDAVQRAAVALRLIETRRPGLIERAVWMLFEDAEESAEPFRAAARRAAARSALARANAHVLEELDAWIVHLRFVRPRLERMGPDQAAHHRRLLEETRQTRAAAAYLMAIAEFEEEAAAPPTSAPATRPAAGTGGD